MSKWTGGEKLQRERAMLELIDVDVLKLSAADVRLGAELVRRIAAPDGHTPTAAQRRLEKDGAKAAPLLAAARRAV